MTNGKVIRLLVADEPFDVRYGELRSHERILDFRDGVLRRTVEWISPTGGAVRISSTRLVSFTQRSIAAILYEVEPLEQSLPVVVQSELVTNEPLPGASMDPRGASPVDAALRCEFFGDRDDEVLLVHSTERSRLRLGTAMSHIVTSPGDAELTSESFADLGRVTISAEVAPGKPLRLVKLIAYGWSSERSTPAVRDQVAAALRGARYTGWEGLLAEQRRYLDDFWDRSDVELAGDAELQQAVRFALFHTLQASARGEQRAIAAKGLTGPGYDGHTFWDAESFVLRVLTYTAPHAAPVTSSAGATTHSIWRGSERGRSASKGRYSPGGRSTERSARATGRPAPLHSTSTLISPMPSCATRRRAMMMPSTVTQA